MPADKEVGLLLFQNVLYLGHIMPRITANVGHVDVDIFNMEKQILGILHSHDVVVDVAVNGAKGLERSQSISRFNTPYVARMPQLINVFEEVEELWDERAVGIGKNTYFLHLRLIINPMANTSLN